MVAEEVRLSGLDLAAFELLGLTQPLDSRGYTVVRTLSEWLSVQGGEVDSAAFLRFWRSTWEAKQGARYPATFHVKKYWRTFLESQPRKVPATGKGRPNPSCPHCEGAGYWVDRRHRNPDGSPRSVPVCECRLAA